MNNIVRAARAFMRHPITLATGWCVVLTVLIFYRYHPQRTWFNADDAMFLLQSAYHVTARDGVILWYADRIGALHLMLAHFFLETLGLKAYISHCTWLLLQQIALILASTVLLLHHWRTTLLVGTLVTLTLLLPNGLNPWFIRIGNIYPCMVFTAVLTLAVMLHYERLPRLQLPWLACIGMTALLALITSTPTKVLFGCWLGLLCLRDIRLLRTHWLRWLLCAFVLAGADMLAGLVRTCYDHSVHLNRTHTLYGFDWSQWLPTLVRFGNEFQQHGIVPTAIVIAGLVIAIVTCARMLVRLIWFPQRCRTALADDAFDQAMVFSVAGFAYLALAAGNQWVHVNSYNPQYTLPTYYLCIAALAAVADALLPRCSWRVMCTAWTLTLAFACGAAWQYTPRAPSALYLRAQDLRACMPAHDTALPLLGDFWPTCELSYFDPHVLVTSPFAGQCIADTMLPQVLSYPRVFVSFEGAAHLRAPGGGIPALMLQREQLLHRSADMPALAARGWFAYTSTSCFACLAATNLLDGAEPVANDIVVDADGMLIMQSTDQSVSQISWPVGALAPGWYMLAFVAHQPVQHAGGQMLVAHLSDQRLDVNGTHLRVSTANLSANPMLLYHVFAYDGSSQPTRVRLYSLSTNTIYISKIGLIAILPP